MLMGFILVGLAFVFGVVLTAVKWILIGVLFRVGWDNKNTIIKKLRLF